MPKVRWSVLLALSAVAALPACSNRDGGMMNLRSSGGPDEFAILPTKPLTLPENLKELPPPTVGGANLTDPTPKADAVTALGGNPRYLTADGIQRGDEGIVAAASRYGVSGNIRTALADEDQEFRSKNRGKLLERLFGVTVYFDAYEKQSLDRYSELERMRRSGIRTPAAPPNPKR